ncbi:LptA/OstA family protein [Hyphobacterium sp.]|uniref:LptA/OstA family protein n=1 Tax=Hyphobacterium sp. TaxID=2004662 RepID=UPI003BACCC17
MITRFLVFAALMLGMPAAALGQIGTQGGPLDITAEQGQVFDSERRAVFIGNVDAAQGDANLRSDRLEVFFSARTGQTGGVGSGWRNVNRVVASGNVFYVTPDEVARGEHAVYELTTETITMTGGVTLTRGRDVITGSCIIVDLATRNSQINSPDCMEAAGEDVTTSDNGRVRFIAFPSGNDEGEEDSDEPAASDEDAEG